MDDQQPPPASQAQATAQAGAAPQAASAADGPLADSLLQNMKELLRELPGLVSDRVHLLALELKRSGLALAQMVGLVVAAGVLLITAWLALWVGIGVALVQAGLGWGWTLVLILLINLGVAWLAVRRALALARFLALPATLRRLTLSTPHQAGLRAAVAATHPPQTSSAGAHDERAASAAGTS